MQNSTPNQMLMLTTRLGENAKMAITGDLKQSDKGLENNGLADFMRKLYGYRRAKMAQEAASGEEREGGVMGGFLGVKLVQLCSTDICRSEIVSRILDMYQVASEAPVSVLAYSTENSNQDWQEEDESVTEKGDIEEGRGEEGRVEEARSSRAHRAR
jgi:phosphate starvation-inducible protein PhoH